MSCKDTLFIDNYKNITQTNKPHNRVNISTLQGLFILIGF